MYTITKKVWNVRNTSPQAKNSYRKEVRWEIHLDGKFVSETFLRRNAKRRVERLEAKQASA